MRSRASFDAGVSNLVLAIPMVMHSVGEIEKANLARCEPLRGISGTCGLLGIANQTA